MAGDVRQPVDVPSLSKYLELHAPEITLPVGIKQFGFGQSNPTYEITASNGSKYVLRKKPPGKLLSKTAHQVEREFRIIDALNPTDVPVPTTYCLCEDEKVIGTAFYVMAFLEGRIFEDASFPGVEFQDRREMWRDAVRTLARLHTVDYVVIGLGDFGKPSNFYNRQLKTLSKIADSQAQAVDVETNRAVGKIPHFDQIVEYLSQSSTQPVDRGTLVHGDYKIDNLVYHPSEPKVIGILDWEMSTVGHPLSDLSNLLSVFTLAVNPPTVGLKPITNPAFSHSAQTPGLPSRSDCIKWYAESAGWDPGPESEWGGAFGTFRNSVIMQGIAARYARRQASSAKAKEHGLLMGPFGEFTWGLIARMKGEDDTGGRRARL